MKHLSTTLLIVGSGPGGYVAAIRAAQLGVKTTLVEQGALGGTCLNVGCIPSKAMIHAASEFAKLAHFNGKSAIGIHVQAPSIDVKQTVKWKDGIVGKLTSGIGALLKKHGVTVVHGRGQIVDGKTVEVRSSNPADPVTKIVCEHLLLATGSSPVEVPGLPFSDAVMSSTEALSPTRLPKHLVVVGAGYIGLELGIVYRKLGCAVTVVEAAGKLLPTYDDELTKPVAKSLRQLGIALHLNSKVTGFDAKAQRVTVAGEGGETHIEADRVLVAVGRRPAIADFGLEQLMLEMQGRFIKIDEQCRTSMRGVWAIGDITGEPMLAHRAMAQGEMVAEIVAGQRRQFMPAAIPAVCFTDPEIVVVGLSPLDAERIGIDVIQANFPFAANGRSLTLESSDGFVRVVARRDNHLIVGWQAVGASVAEFAAAFTYSLEMGMRLDDVGAAIHAHPTLGEAMQEAALRALGHAIHI